MHRVYVLLLLVMGLVRPAEATVLLPATLTDLTVEARAIVHARVVDLRAQWAEGRRRIETLVTIEVHQYLKGELGKRVTLRVPGGELGVYRTIIPGAPVLRVGEEVVLFLGARGPSFPYVLGLSQGLARVLTDPASGRKLVRAPLVAAAGGRPVPIVRGDPSRRAIPLDELARRVQEILARPAGARQ